MQKDTLIIGGKEFTSRFFLGTGKFSLEKTKETIESGGVEMVTLALRRANLGGGGNILDYIPKTVTLLPTPPGPGMQRKRCASPGSPGSLAAGTL